MTACLQITTGRHRSQIIPLREGQVLRIGRTQWSDVCLPGDPELSPVHFSVEFTGRELIVRDLSQGVGVVGPDGPIRLARLINGACLKAGQTEFEVQISQPLDAAIASPTTDRAESIAPWNWKAIPLSKPAAQLLSQVETPAELLSKLQAAGLYADAWHVLTNRVGAARVVGWLAAELDRNMSSQKSVEDTRCLDAVRRWVVKPTAESIGFVQQQIPDELNSPGAWIAQAVCWTAPNQIPDDIGQVPTPPALCGRGCACTVTFFALLSAQPNVSACQLEWIEAADLQFRITSRDPLPNRS